jgi:ribosomal protein L31E
MESVMTISLSKKLGETHKPRAIRNASSTIRFLVARSAKVDMSFVSIDQDVNNYLMSKALKNRSKIKLNVSRSGNDVKVSLHGAKPAKPAQQAAAQKTQGKQPAKEAQKKEEPKKAAPAGEKAKPAADSKKAEQPAKPKAEPKGGPAESKEGKTE